MEESEGAVTITVLRGSDDASRSFTVDFATADRTAKAGIDYTASQGRLSFDPGQTQATLAVPVLKDDLVEGDEQFVVLLSNLTEGTFFGGPTNIAVELFDSTGEVPHRFDGISVTPDGGMELKLGGASPYEDERFHALFPIEVSHDLVNWRPRVTLVRTNPSPRPFAWTDGEAGSTDRRFYRTPAGSLGSLLTPFASRPTGPFPVGVQWRRLTDPARRNRYGVSTNSSFMVSVWYPAIPRAGQVPALVSDPRLLPYFVTHASMDAPGANEGAPYPVVLYSHGFQNDRGSASERGPELASHGYVVVAVDHYDAIWFKIGRSVHISMGGHDYEWSGTPAYMRDVREARRTVNAYALAFLNRHLKGMEAPLLDRPPADFPRIANWKKK